MKSRRKSKRSAKVGYVRPDWHQRVDPAFLHYWSQKKLNPGWGSAEEARDENLPKKKAARSGTRMADATRKLDAVAAKLGDSTWGFLQSAILKPLDIELKPEDRQQSSSGSNNKAIAYPINPEASAFFRKLVFLKHGITFRELIWRCDIEKDPDAHRMLMKVHRDYWLVQSGREFKGMRLKFSWDHFDMIAHGLDFGFDKLDHYELAECLDEICPCGTPKHSAEYAKKQRTWIKQQWKRISDSSEGSASGARYPL
jgi:hypothetical protein